MIIKFNTEKLKKLSITEILVLELYNKGFKKYDEIGSILKLKRDTVYRHIKKLCENGFIQWDNFNEFNNGFVYLAKNTVTNDLKIGYSVNPKNRISNLNTSSPNLIKLLSFKRGTMIDERKLHLKYKSMRKNGEWFSYNQNIINEFKK